MILQFSEFSYWYWYWNCKRICSIIIIGIDIARSNQQVSILILVLQSKMRRLSFWYWYCRLCLALECVKFTPKKAFDSTIIEPNIDIDTEILQNNVKLKIYCYWKRQTFDIVIDIAYLKKMVLIPILILLDKLN